MAKTKQNLILAITGSVLITVVGTLGVLSQAGWLVLPEANRQTMVHDMGSQVMPFSLGDTKHIFEMTESGGIQQVVANDSNDAAQIELIQQHLAHEATRFSTGDFSDPTTLHGSELPGIQELSVGVDHVKIEYSALPDGAQIVFTADDIKLITAIHGWFGAQLSDHGSDATYR